MTSESVAPPSPPSAEKLEELCKWCYQGTWRIVTEWFRVPDRPPTLPQLALGSVQAFKPSRGYLQYLRFHFWISLVVIDLALSVGWSVLLIAVPLIGVLIAPLAIAVIVLPDIVAYIALHLRYDTTWYVISDRSLRIRRGIWVIQETTITYENIQNVTVRQGPLQRWFGIADLVVETAGGGSVVGKEGAAMTNLHKAVFEGIDNPKTLRELILKRVKESRSAGLGDDANEPGPETRTPLRTSVGVSGVPLPIETLREIRDLLAAAVRR